MKKTISVLVAVLVLFSALALAEIPRTYISSRDQASATIDGNVITEPLRPKLKMSYREHFYERRNETFDSGHIGLILSGF